MIKFIKKVLCSAVDLVAMVIGFIFKSIKNFINAVVRILS